MANNNLKITLYSCTAQPNKLDKFDFLTERAVKNGYMKDANSISSPTLVLNYTADALETNYVYIEEFHRYYFVKDKIVEPGKRIELQLAVDVLMSFYGAIRNLQIYVERTGDANIQDTYIQDNLYVPKQYTESFIFEFPYNFNRDSGESLGGKGVYLLMK